MNPQFSLSASGRLLLRFAVIVIVAFAATSHAQIRVDLSFNRSMFIRYEPMIAIVTITNLSGQEIELADEGNYKWFSFKIETTTGRLVPPYDPDYQLMPIQLGPGQSAKRQVNLTPLYPMTEFGVYRVVASIYSRQLGKYFNSSPPLNVEVTEGRTLWEQVVGVPGESGVRMITVLAHRLPKYTQLYLRIQNKEAGLVYCTHQLGRYVSMGGPEVELDAANQVHILQPTAPKEFLYSHFALDGKPITRKQYHAISNKPTLRKDASGGVSVVGGVPFEAKKAVPAEGGPDAPAATPALPPSVSDRPVPVPQ